MENMVLVLSLAAVVLVLFLLIVFIIWWGHKYKKTKIIELVQKIKDTIFWNSILRSQIQMFLANAISILIGMSVLSFDSEGMANSIMSILLTLVLLIIFPGFTFAFMYKKRDDLRKP